MSSPLATFLMKGKSSAGESTVILGDSWPTGMGILPRLAVEKLGVGPPCQQLERFVQECFASAAGSVS